MSDSELIENDEYWIIPSGDSWVTRVSFDWAISLLIGSGTSSFEIRVQGELRLKALDGSVLAIDPEGEIGQLAGALVLLRQPVASAYALKNGDLNVGLADGRALHVGRSDDCEAWEVSTPGGMRIVSVPGGNLAVWRG